MKLSSAEYVSRACDTKAGKFCFPLLSTGWVLSNVLFVTCYLWKSVMCPSIFSMSFTVLFCQVSCVTHTLVPFPFFLPFLFHLQVSLCHSTMYVIYWFVLCWFGLLHTSKVFSLWCTVYYILIWFSVWTISFIALTKNIYMAWLGFSISNKLGDFQIALMLLVLLWLLLGVPLKDFKKGVVNLRSWQSGLMTCLTMDNFFQECEWQLLIKIHIKYLYLCLYTFCKI